MDSSQGGWVTEGSPLPDVRPFEAFAYSFRSFRRNLPTHLLFFLPLILVGTAVILVELSYDAPDPTATTGTEARALAEYAGRVLPWTLLYGALWISWVGGGALLVREEHPRIGEVFVRFVRRLVPLLGASVLLEILAFSSFLPPVFLGLLLGSLVGLGAEGGIVLALLLAIPTLLFVFSRVLLVPTSIVLENQGVADSFRRSLELTQKGRGSGVAALALFTWFSFALLTDALGKGVLALLEVLQALPPAPEEASALAARPFDWVLSPLVPGAIASFHLLTLERIRTPTTSKGEEFRTTRCPSCGTIVPYRATGAEVPVECPSCGRKGVLKIS